MPGEPRQLPELRAALGSRDRHRRATAAIELGQHGDRQSLDRLRELTSDADDLVAIAAMFATWRLGDGGVDMERMIAATASDDEELVQESVFALCEMGDSVVPRLEGLLESQSPYAKNILRVLADIGSATSRETITRFETEDPELKSTIRALLEDWGEDE